MTLPNPKSRKEQYLAKAAGMSTTIPEKPESREEQYLEAIANNGGGGGGTTNFDNLTNRPKYNGTTMDSTTDIPEVKTYTAGANITIDANDEISATDTTYSDFVGTDGTSAGTAGLVPAPATTDADKFLKSDGTWDTAGGGQSTFTDLTSADCNANRNNWSDTDPANFNCIAMWKLPPGIYTISDKTVYVFLSKTYGGKGEIELVIVKDALPRDGDFNQYKLIYAFNSPNGAGNNVIGPSQRWVVSSGGYDGSELQSNIYTRTALTTYNIATSYSQIDSYAYFPNMVAGLQAVNGYVNLRIRNGGTTAPTASTSGAVGTLYSYVDTGTNTPHLYSCVDTTGGTYTWVQLI